MNIPSTQWNILVIYSNECSYGVSDPEGMNKILLSLTL